MRGAPLVLLALAGCAIPLELPAPAGVADDDARVVACRHEARNAPDVVLLARSAWADAPADQARRDRERAMLAAYRDCLEREGLTRGGGVEPVREPAFRPRMPNAPAEPGPVRGVPLERPAPTGF